jgi:hypothetical protein
MKLFKEHSFKYADKAIADMVSVLFYSYSIFSHGILGMMVSIAIICILRSAFFIRTALIISRANARIVNFISLIVCAYSYYYYGAATTIAVVLFVVAIKSDKMAKIMAGTCKYFTLIIALTVFSIVTILVALANLGSYMESIDCSQPELYSDVAILFKVACNSTIAAATAVATEM